MASLTGQLVAETYKALLKTIDNDILTASEKQITDGFGGGSNVFIDSQGFLRANKYKVTNGLATQFLKADGSLDSNTYLTGITSSQIITALGYTPVTNARTLTINGTTYDLSANRSWTIAGTAAVWGNISGTLSNQTDLQTALNAKYNNPTGTISQYIRGDGTIANFPTLPGGLPTGGTAGQILAKIDATDYNTHWIDNYATQTKNEVKLGATLAKGAAVYVSSANGTNMIVSAASNTSEATSSKTFGLLETGGVTNDLVKCVTFGLLAGLDTSTAQAGDPVWLGVNGALIFGLANKPVAPAHMVYIGVVTRVQQNNGEIFVNVQNGFEIEELHDVLIQSKANNQGLFYESSTGLWKNKSIATVLGYTPQAQLDGTGFVKATGTTISYDNSTYLTTTDADSTYQRLSNLSSNLNPSTTRYPSINAVIAGLDLKLDLTGGTLTGSITATSFVKTGGTSVQYLKADGSVAEITGDIVSGAGSAGYVPKWTSAIVLGSSILYDNGTSMGIGSTNVNYHAYGRSLTGSGFASNSFGFEASSAATTNGSLIGGLSMIISANDSTRRIGSAIQSYISGSTATNLGADLRFYAKPDNGVLAEIIRITSSLITFNKDLTAANITATSFVKSGGTASQFLMADGSVSTLSSPVTGSGSAGYIPKWTTAANIGSSNIYDDGTSIGIAYSTPNKGGYGRTITGAAFGSASFGFEAVGGTTTNGGLVGGLSFILSQNDSSRIVGSAIQSNLVGTTATNYGADLRFYAKADAGVIGEVARMTSAGLRVYGTIIKDGGTATQFLKADGSIDSNTYLTSSSAIDWSNIASKPTTLSGYGITNAVQAYYNFDIPMTTVGDWIGMSQSTGISGWTHVLNLAWSNASQDNWVSQIAFAAQSGAGAYYRTTSGAITSASWVRLLDASNYSSYALPLSGGTMTGIINNTTTYIGYRAQVDGTSGIWRGIIGSYNASADIGTFIGNYAGKSGIFGHNNSMGAWNTLRINSLGSSGMGKVILSNNTVVNADSSDTEYGIWHQGNATRAGNSNLMYYAGFTLDANAMPSNTTGFTYAVNAPYTGPIVKFSEDGYPLQLNATYGGGGTSISYRTRNGDAGTWNSWYAFITTANIASQSVASAITLSTDRTNWNSNGTISAVVGQLGWKNYGNSHTIFDASQGTSPNGTGVSQTNATYAWTASYPTLMGWNGANTYGVRVDMARYADTAGTAVDSSKLPLTGGTLTGGIVINATSNGVGTSLQLYSSAYHQYMQIYSNGDYEAMVNYRNSSSQWYAGLRTSTQLVGTTGFHFYNTTSGQTVGGFDINGCLYSIGGVTTNGTITTPGVVNMGSNSGNNVGAGIYYSSSYYGRIRFYSDGSNNSTIHSFGSSWVGGTSAGYINIDGANGVNFGGWDNADVNIARNGTTQFYRTTYAHSAGNTSSSAGSGFQLYSPTGSGTGAFLSFHRAGAYAVNMGLDSDNVFRIGGWSASGNRLQLDMSGNLYVAGSMNAPAFYESSDMRLKTLIDGSAQVAGIENLQAKLYEKDGKIEFGYFAQDAQELMPYAVTTNMDGFLNLSYREVHTAKIARLEKRVAELEKQLNLN